MTNKWHLFDNRDLGLWNSIGVQTIQPRSKMMEMNFKFLSLFFLLLSSMSFEAFAKIDIQQIHEQYLTTDFKSEEQTRKMILAIKEGVIEAQSAHPENTVLESNLLGLFNQVIAEAQKVRFPEELLNVSTGKKTLDLFFAKMKDYEEKHGKVIPLDWSLPEELKTLVISVDRRYDVYKDRVGFSLSLFGWINQGQVAPEEFQVIRYPDTVLVDKRGKIGNWYEESGKDFQHFDAGTENDKTPPKDGLYLVNIKMKGKEMVKGWFIVSNMTLSESPAILSPTLGQSLAGPNPEIKWRDLPATTLYRPFESRKRMLGIFMTDDNKHVKRWARKEINPDHRESIIVKQSTDTDNDGNINTNLEKGRYRLEMTFQERWVFGDVLLQRGTMTIVPFSIK